MWSDLENESCHWRTDAIGQRWHQVVSSLPTEGSLPGAGVLLGFACDAGVQRNHGRAGADGGPNAIRRALGNLAFHHQRQVFDAGTVACENGELEQAQQALSARVSEILQRGGQPLVLGGGHEVAWGSYQGIRDYLGSDQGRLGIINFDAHFDLRDPARGGNSGTPFRQIAEHCAQTGREFPYLVFGINPAANTSVLFDYAQENGVRWFEDADCHSGNLAALEQAVEDFLEPLDYLYLTICLDAFPVALAPGVSAPGVPGICPHTALRLLRTIICRCREQAKRLLLVDIAEMNPCYDSDGITARWAARLVQEAISY